MNWELKKVGREVESQDYLVAYVSRSNIPLAQVKWTLR